MAAREVDLGRKIGEHLDKKGRGSQKRDVMGFRNGRQWAGDKSSPAKEAGR